MTLYARIIRLLTYFFRCQYCGSKEMDWGNRSYCLNPACGKRTS